MKIIIKGYVIESGKYKAFNDIYFADTAQELHDLRGLLERDGVHIESITDTSGKFYFLTHGERVAMGHAYGEDTAKQNIYIYKSNGLTVEFLREVSASDKLLKRSERLATESKIEVNIGNFAIAKIITSEQMSRQAASLRYIGTDYEALYNGGEVWANVYEDDDGSLYAVID